MRLPTPTSLPGILATFLDGNSRLLGLAALRLLRLAAWRLLRFLIWLAALRLLRLAAWRLLRFLGRLLRLGRFGYLALSEQRYVPPVE